MIDWPTAQQIAADVAAAVRVSDPGDRAVIDARATVEYEFGWLFQYQSARYLATGDDRAMLLNNARFVVDRRTGHVTTVRRPQLAALIAAYTTAYRTGAPPPGHHPPA